MTLPDRSDPERRLSIEERVDTAVSQFRRGAITEDVFRATLHGCGMRETAIDAAVREHRPARSLAEVSAPVLGKFVSGLQ